MTVIDTWVAFSNAKSSMYGPMLIYLAVVKINKAAQYLKYIHLIDKQDFEQAIVRDRVWCKSHSRAGKFSKADLQQQGRTLKKNLF